MTTPLLQELVADLQPQQRQELADAISYMTEHASTGRPPPEGGYARIINQLSPQVRSKFELISQLLETPRMMPFQPKLGNDEYSALLDADPQLMANVKRGMDDEDIAAQLQRKMGTDASAQYGKEPAPMTLREQLAAALDLHGPDEHFLPAMSNASAHLPMKDALKIITAHKAKE